MKSNSTPGAKEQKSARRLHVMISLKSLGLDDSSVVTALGAVAFDPTGETDVHLDKKNQFYTTISNVDSTMNGFKVDPVTINWLKSTGGLDPLKKELKRADTPVRTAFCDLITFIEKKDPEKIFANSPRFHFTYIEGVCRKMDIPFKFEPQQEGDYRTLMDFRYPDRADRPAHDASIAGFPPQHALGDSIMQAVNLINIKREYTLAMDALERLKPQGKPDSTPTRGGLRP